MARRVDPVFRKAWFRGLRDLDKSVWFTLRSGLDVPRIPGLLDCGIGQLADAVGASARRIQNVLRRYTELGIGEYDPVQQVIRTVVFPEDAPANYNVLQGWFGEWREFPDCPLKYKHVDSLRAIVDLGKPEWVRTWEQTFGGVQIPADVLAAMNASIRSTDAIPACPSTAPAAPTQGETVTPRVTSPVSQLPEGIAPPTAPSAAEPTPEPLGEPLPAGSPLPASASDHLISNCDDDPDSETPDSDAREATRGTVPEGRGEPIPQPQGEPLPEPTPKTSVVAELPPLDRARPEPFAAAVAERVAGTGSLDDQALGDAAVKVLSEIGGTSFRVDASRQQRMRLGEIFRDRGYTLEQWVLFVLWVREERPRNAFDWDVGKNGVEGVVQKGFVSVRFLLGARLADGSYEGEPLATGMGKCLQTLAARKEKARVDAARAAEERVRVHRASERTPGIMKVTDGLNFGPGRASNGTTG